jgi:hypothetical protein
MSEDNINININIKEIGWDVDGTSSWCCLVAGFDIGGVEPRDPTTRDLIT